MNAESVRLFKEPHRSFIFHKEVNPSFQRHDHPEYELSLITKGRGVRVVGDSETRFEDNDLVLIGAYTPHESLFDPEYYDHPDGFQGEGIFIQFEQDFLGEGFFNVPEHAGLNRFLMESTRGYSFFGETRSAINSILRGMVYMNDRERIYSLLSIFRIFSTTEEIKILSGVAFQKPVSSSDPDPIQIAIDYILKNFQKPIHVNDLLEITKISNTSFYAKFKNTCNMSFKDYLLHTRVGHACKLLSDGATCISEVAYQSGFENISNFNRQFRKIKGKTPSEWQGKAGKNGRMQIGSRQSG